MFTNGPSGPIARYGLQSYPGVTQAAALDNTIDPGTGQALTATDVTWTDDVRIIGGKTATFTGTASQGAVAGGVVLDTTKSYSVAAWVRLTDVTTTSTLIAKGAAAGASNPFRLRARPLSTGGNAWCLLASSGSSAAGTEVCSTALNTAGQWTHVAAAFDSVERRIRVWVDGQETSAAFDAPITNGNAIVVGRGQDPTGSVVERLRGNVADVQIFDRLLVADDFTGKLAARTTSGEVDIPGILDPIQTAKWSFDLGVSCFDESIADTCEVPADDQFGRRLATTVGSVVDGGSLYLDTKLAFQDTPPGTVTKEYGRSQRRTEAPRRAGRTLRYCAPTSPSPSPRGSCPRTLVPARIPCCPRTARTGRRSGCLPGQ